MKTYARYLGVCLWTAALWACESDPKGAGPVDVGDDYRGGVVSDVGRVVGDCFAVTIEHSAEWRCTEAQITFASSGGPSVDGWAPPGETTSLGFELKVSSCSELAQMGRKLVKTQERADAHEQRRAALSRCLPTRETLYMNAHGGSCADTRFNADAGVAFFVPTEELPTPSGGATETTSTNNQVVGVDEADIVKNDNQYVYTVGKEGVHVIDAWPAAETHEVAFIPVAGHPTRLFLNEGRLAIYATSAGGTNVCSYGYSCRTNAEPGPTQLLVFDVTQPSAPRELRRYAFSGGFSAARRIGSVVHTVLEDRLTGTVARLNLTVSGSDADAVDSSYAATKVSIDTLIDAMPDDVFLPKVTRPLASGATQQAVDGCEQALIASSADGASLTSLVSFDMATLSEPKRTVIASKPGFVYSSAAALYIATDGVGAQPYVRSAKEQTTLHKIALAADGSRYVGSVLVPGHVLNQFSMDERENVLRVATSSGWVPDPAVSSNVVTVAETGGKLSVLGTLAGLAPQEDIRSVRFDGDRAFIVTFKKTDPLYAIGLSDPAKPVVLGELKIPGFSTYMHPLDRDHLLAIGYDADDMGNFAYFNGIQIQIFDVSDLSAPKLLHKATIGTRGSSSEALTNHLAFTYFASRGLLALPMTICEGGGNGTYGNQLTFSGLMVFDATVAGGIRERGRMPFETGAGIHCGNWWTDAQSEVKRSIFMDDFAIGISATAYKVAALSELSKPLKSIAF